METYERVGKASCLIPLLGQCGVSCRIMDFALIRGIEEVWSDLFKWLHSDRECSGTGVGRAFRRRLVACSGGRI
jgi:hypothetical protein